MTLGEQIRQDCPYTACDGKQMVENDMRPSVVMWLNRNGYYDAHECLIGGYCDIIGCLWEERVGRRIPQLLETIAIELKMRKISEVISQAKGNHYHTNLSYCAMPAGFVERMRLQSKQKFRDAGIGLLSISPCNVDIEIFSNYKNSEPHPAIARRLWNFKVRHPIAPVLNRIGAFYAQGVR